MVSTLSVFRSSLMFINPAQLFHNFQSVEWFAQHWMICNYDVKCILTALTDLFTVNDTFNALYYVEWFVLSWMCFEYIERFALLLNNLKGSMKLPPGKYPPEDWLRTSLPWKSQKWTLPHKKTSLVKIHLVKIPPLSLKSKIMKIKASSIGIFQKSSLMYQNYFRS